MSRNGAKGRSHTRKLRSGGTKARTSVARSRESQAALTKELKAHARELEKQLEARTRGLSEVLEQQTATSEVLQVISSSPSDLQPVFQVILKNATRLCEAQFGTLNLYDGETYRIVAYHNVPPTYAETQRHMPFRPHPGSGLAQAARTKQVVHIDDLRTQPPYLEGDSAAVAVADLGGRVQLSLSQCSRRTSWSA